MRQSLSKLIDTCFDIKVHLQVSSYELHDYEDGAYAVFKIYKIKDPKTLLRIIGKHECIIYAESQYLCIKVFEDYQEY